MNRHNPPVMSGNWRAELQRARKKRKLGEYKHLQEPFKLPEMIPEDGKRAPKVRVKECPECGGPMSKKATRCRPCSVSARPRIEAWADTRTKGECVDCGRECRPEAKRCLECSTDLSRSRRSEDVRKAKHAKKRGAA